MRLKHSGFFDRYEFRILFTKPTCAYVPYEDQRNASICVVYNLKIAAEGTDDDVATIT